MSQAGKLSRKLVQQGKQFSWVHKSNFKANSIKLLFLNMWGNIKNSTVNENVNEETATDKKLYAKRHVDHAINYSYWWETDKLKLFSKK